MLVLHCKTAAQQSVHPIPAKSAGATLAPDLLSKSCVPWHCPPGQVWCSAGVVVGRFAVRVFKRFSWLGVGSVKAASSGPAHQRVMHAVGSLVKARVASSIEWLLKSHNRHPLAGHDGNGMAGQVTYITVNDRPTSTRQGAQVAVHRMQLPPIHFSALIFSVFIADRRQHEQ